MMRVGIPSLICIISAAFYSDRIVAQTETCVADPSLHVQKLAVKFRLATTAEDGIKQYLSVNSEESIVTTTQEKNALEVEESSSFWTNEFVEAEESTLTYRFLNNKEGKYLGMNEEGRLMLLEAAPDSFSCDLRVLWTILLEPEKDSTSEEKRKARIQHNGTSMYLRATSDGTMEAVAEAGGLWELVVDDADEKILAEQRKAAIKAKRDAEKLFK